MAEARAPREIRCLTTLFRLWTILIRSTSRRRLRMSSGSFARTRSSSSYVTPANDYFRDLGPIITTRSSIMTSGRNHAPRTRIS